MKAQDFNDWAKRHGYVEKRGNWYKTDGSRRFVVSDVALRLERRVIYAAQTYNGVTYPARPSEWIRVSSNYLKDIGINEQDQLTNFVGRSCQDKPEVQHSVEHKETVRVKTALRDLASED